MNRPATLLVLLLAGLLTGCGGGSRPTGIRAAETPADDVAEYQPRWRSHTVDSTQYRKVFLAGTIDMGRSSDWQAALVARFRDSIGGRWLFFNPAVGSSMPRRPKWSIRSRGSWRTSKRPTSS